MARMAGVTVIASSQNGADGQTAAKAVDGVASGYPVDYTREWATARQTVGAWIELSFPAPVEVGRVVLFDRPNQSDWVTGGSLGFSDGSTVAVGQLNNDGSATQVTFASRTVTSVRFTVTNVGSGTVNVGLSEFEIWGALASA